MAYTLVIGGEQEFPLASSAGWSDAKKWIDTLDAEPFEALVHLAEHGWAEGLSGLESQLATALENLPPSDKSVLTTAQGLLASIQQRDPAAESAHVSDGTGPDNGAPDEMHYSEFDG